MKLLICTRCQDVIKLMKTERICECGAVGGRYLDDLNAEYWGAAAVPLGFANTSLAGAVNNQPKSGMGLEFTAFVIPRVCPTMVKIRRHRKQKVPA